ncbi:MAG: DUF1501 domain-containing protein, partial [Armatimonadetes bacterium]|nr:DUF1501 domain-containing protein [Armatimonadota bacterium]
MRTPMNPHVIRPTTRREMLQVCSAGFGSLALAALAAEEANAAPQPGPSPRTHSPLAARPAHFTPRARRVVFLFMGGGPSAIDTFDPKPRLDRDDGQPLPFKHPVGIIDPDGKLMRSPWSFRQYGQAGIPVSELFPHVAGCVDDLCIVRSVHTEGQAHGHAVLKLHTGDAAFVRPSIGSWVLYGLGTENQNLPGFVTISPTLDTGGAQLYGNAFLPAVYQGTALGQQGVLARQAAFPHLNRPGTQAGVQRRQLDFLQELNREFQ